MSDWLIAAARGTAIGVLGVTFLLVLALAVYAGRRRGVPVAHWRWYR